MFLQNISFFLILSLSGPLTYAASTNHAHPHAHHHGSQKNSDQGSNKTNIGNNGGYQEEDNIKYEKNKHPITFQIDSKYRDGIKKNKNHTIKIIFFTDKSMNSSVMKESDGGSVSFEIPSNSVPIVSLNKGETFQNKTAPKDGSFVIFKSSAIGAESYGLAMEGSVVTLSLEEAGWGDETYIGKISTDIPLLK